MEKFDRGSLTKLDRMTKKMVDTHYDHCIHKCNLNWEDGTGNVPQCKQNCFHNIVVPYKILLHQAQDSEENLYRQCLADKFPNIKTEDYFDCTNQIYNQRVEILSTHLADTCQNILMNLHQPL